MGYIDQCVVIADINDHVDGQMNIFDYMRNEELEKIPLGFYKTDGSDGFPISKYKGRTLNFDELSNYVGKKIIKTSRFFPDTYQIVKVLRVINYYGSLEAEIQINDTKTLSGDFGHDYIWKNHLCSTMDIYSIM